MAAKRMKAVQVEQSQDLAEIAEMVRRGEPTSAVEQAWRSSSLGQTVNPASIGLISIANAQYSPQHLELPWIVIICVGPTSLQVANTMRFARFGAIMSVVSCDHAPAVRRLYTFPLPEDKSRCRISKTSFARSIKS